jgi:hypothetical protein
VEGYDLTFFWDGNSGVLPVEITVNEQLEHGCGMVGRTTRVIGLSLETQARQVELINEDIDDSQCAIFSNVVVESFGK